MPVMCSSQDSIQEARPQRHRPSLPSVAFSLSSSVLWLSGWCEKPLLWFFKCQKTSHPESLVYSALCWTLTLKKYIKFIYYPCACVCTHAWHSMYVKVREQLMVVGLFFPPFVFLWSNSGRQAWWQHFYLLTAEASPGPHAFLLKDKIRECLYNELFKGQIQQIACCLKYSVNLLEFSMQSIVLVCFLFFLKYQWVKPTWWRQGLFGLHGLVIVHHWGKSG